MACDRYNPRTDTNGRSLSAADYSMLAKLEFQSSSGRRKASPHRLVVIDGGRLSRSANGKLAAAAVAESDLLASVLRRAGKKVGELTKSPVSATTSDGGLIAWIAWDPRAARFERQTALRKAVSLLLADAARAIGVELDPSLGEDAAGEVLQVCWVNGIVLPNAKAEPDRQPLGKLSWTGTRPDVDSVRPLVEGNVLARRLTAMAPNVLTPRALRAEALAIAKRSGLASRVYDMKALHNLGCGAFLSVAQGSDDDEAAIVHLRHRPKAAKGRIALVGKGICFDTGGYNVKPARAMAGMHEDMAGAAVVLGLMQAAVASGMPLAIDGWLAISRNRIAPAASVPGDVVRAVNGKTIEIVHTDAEGRMVLADTLALAAKENPDLVLDFATLTGSMVVALGTRMAGVLSPDPQLAARAVDAGARAGERLVAFPVPADYRADLDSEVADIKQCTPDGEADHILAATFLRNFVGERAWLHMDLSAVRCKGGLGAVATDVTGFGVAAGLELLRDFSGSL